MNIAGLFWLLATLFVIAWVIGFIMNAGAWIHALPVAAVMLVLAELGVRKREAAGPR